jgi:hypothetical protein
MSVFYIARTVHCVSNKYINLLHLLVFLCVAPNASGATASHYQAVQGAMADTSLFDISLYQQLVVASLTCC